MNYSIIIYEDNLSLTESLSCMFSMDNTLQLLATFNNVISVEEDVRRLNPDIILMDIEMPGMTGIEAVQKIRGFNNEVKIIMLTVFDDSRHILEAIYAGASGYILKKDIAKKLFNAIDEVMAGGAPMSPSVARMVLNSIQTPICNSYDLSAREKEVLASLSRGNSFKMIAAEFSISADTVKTHIKNIYRKLHVNSQTEAVSKALKEKLV